MRIIIALLLFAFLAWGQTPFEFAVVQDLVQGTPFISVLRIQIDPGAPEPGRSQLELSVRMAMQLSGKQDVYPDSANSTQVVFSGLVDYSAAVPVNELDRVFSVLEDCMDRFPGMGITDLALDVVDVDDMTWISIDCPMSRVDSVLQGTISHQKFWQEAQLREFEVGTLSLPTRLRQPLMPEISELPDTIPDLSVSAVPHAQPLKSLILPGWGQLSSGRGIGWLNLAVEAGGIALLASGEEERGIAVLGVNHIISFIDLF